MSALSAGDLIKQLSTIVDPAFARDVVQSYVEMQQRFWAGDWQPAELDAGRLCEAVSRALLQVDLGLVSHTETPGPIRDQLLSNKVSHNLALKDRQHICKVIEVVYKLRSDRGAVHISPVHTANHIDSVFVLHSGKWILAEFLRLVWNKDMQEIARVIEQLAQLDHSLIHELDGKPMVTAKAVTTAEEILILLFHASGYRLGRAGIHDLVVNRSKAGVNAAIRSLIESKEIRIAANGEVAITPPGQNRVMTQIVPKLT